jgi:hypothetical protein
MSTDHNRLLEFQGPLKIATEDLLQKGAHCFTPTGVRFRGGAVGMGESVACKRAIRAPVSFRIVWHGNKFPEHLYIDHLGCSISVGAQGASKGVIRRYEDRSAPCQPWGFLEHTSGDPDGEGYHEAIIYAGSGFPTYSSNSVAYHLTEPEL